MANDDCHFDSAQASAICGLSRTMVDYLARSSVVRPTVRRGPGRGRRRLYSFGDLVTLRAVKVLLRAGVSVAKLKRGMATLQKKYGRSFESCPADFFLTDGRTVLFRSSIDVVADITAGGQLVFGFMCDLRQLHTDTAKLVKAHRVA
jgi:MerR HTH family regulatory protein